MSKEKYTGMNALTGRAINNDDHINQSIKDILTTPVGSRVMRRNYGSQLHELIDQPMNEVNSLRIMSAIFSALYRWEQRISLSHISLEIGDKGELNAGLTMQRTDSLSSLTTDILLKG